MQHTKGRGTDCVAYIACALHDSGILNSIDFPKYYPRDWATLPGYERLIVDHVRANLLHNLRDDVTFAQIEPPEDQPEPFRGDIVLFNLRYNTSAINHTGVVVSDGSMIHLSSEVAKVSYGNTWRSIQKVTFRLLRRT